jgi:hypothetical protein
MIKAFYKFLSPKFQKVYLEYKVDVSPRYGHGKPAHPELLAITQKQDETNASYLKAVTKYQPLFANYYVSENNQLAAIIADFWKHENTKNVEKHGGSFWLKIN